MSVVFVLVNIQSTKHSCGTVLGDGIEIFVIQRKARYLIPTLQLVIMQCGLQHVFFHQLPHTKCEILQELVVLRIIDVLCSWICMK